MSYSIADEPAFPIKYESHGTIVQLGLSKRDYIAIEAMKALITHESRHADAKYIPSLINDSFAVADAMIKRMEQ